MNNIDWDSIKAKIAEDNKQSDTTSAAVFLGGDLFFEIEQIKEKPEDNYFRRKRFLSLLKNLKALSYKTEAVKELYKIAFDFLNSEYKDLSNAISEDIKELDICYSAKAYKATLILAGSILEAFLLDWLSEIDGVNYFEEPYKVLVRDKDGNTHWEKKEELYVYINNIEEIEHPEWMEASEKAHFIRQKRNSVHAKIHLKHGYDINAFTCEKVISYLTYIIDTRLDKKKAELEAYNE